MAQVLPDRIRAAVPGAGGDALIEFDVEPICHGTGAATGRISRLTGVVRMRDGRQQPVRMVRKTLEPLSAGRHAVGSSHPRHWAYWRREAMAYRLGLVPSGPGLKAPHCYGVVGNDIYLEAVEGPPASMSQAAEHLARWQVDYDRSLDRSWLATDQLGRRLEVTQLDWANLDADSRAIRLWDRRHELYRALRQLPRVRSHGDYSVGNLVTHGADTVAFDWATVGWEPIGFDLAHLALSRGEDPTGVYAKAASRSRSRESVEYGFRGAVAIIGASRVHWMLSRHVEVPPWYVDFVWDHRPD